MSLFQTLQQKSSREQELQDKLQKLETDKKDLTNKLTALQVCTSYVQELSCAGIAFRLSLIFFMTISNESLQKTVAVLKVWGRGLWYGKHDLLVRILQVLLIMDIHDTTTDTPNTFLGEWTPLLSNLHQRLHRNLIWRHTVLCPVCIR